MRNIFAILLISLSVTSTAVSQGQPKCLRRFRVIGTTPTSITLGWNYNCKAEHEVSYKVYYEHKKWMACPQNVLDSDRGPGRGNFETDEEVLVLRNLHPYSLYELEIKALAKAKSTGKSVSPPEEELVIGETLTAVPSIAPSESVIPTPRATSTTLQFNWRDPPPGECRFFNGQLDGTRFVLKGTSVWNQDVRIEGKTNRRMETFRDLTPFSEYSLYLYAQDNEGRHNPDVFFRIPAKTSAQIPGPPVSLSEDRITNSDARLIKWLPPNPPFGEIRQYKLRWKAANATVYVDKLEVFPSNDMCGNAEDVRNGFVCQAVADLDPRLNYTFQVSAYNRGFAESSRWSEEYLSPSTANDESTILGVQKSVFIVVVISSIVAVVLILIVVSLIGAFISKRNKYRNVPHYESRVLMHSPPGSTLTSPTTAAAAGSLPPPFGSSTARTSFASTIQPDSLRRYQQHLLPLERLSRPGSIQEQPLPPLPNDDHTYEELKLKKEKVLDKRTPPSSLDLNVSHHSSQSINNDSSDYLAPRTAADLSRMASADTLDMEDYLKPTFDKFEHINTKDLSPPTESPPPIPTVSYSAPIKKSPV